MSTATKQVLERIAAALGGASPASVMAGKRNKWAIRVRHTTMLALRRRGLSFPQIGAALGGMDHTTVINGCKKAAVLEVVDDDVRDALTAEARLMADEELAETLKRLHRPPPRPDDHQRLAAACGELIEAVIGDVEWEGDLAAAMKAIAAGFNAVSIFENPRPPIRERLEAVMREAWDDAPEVHG